MILISLYFVSMFISTYNTIHESKNTVILKECRRFIFENSFYKTLTQYHENYLALSPTIASHVHHVASLRLVTSVVGVAFAHKNTKTQKNYFRNKVLACLQFCDRATSQVNVERLRSFHLGK